MFDDDSTEVLPRDRKPTKLWEKDGMQSNSSLEQPHIYAKASSISCLHPKGDQIQSSRHTITAMDFGPHATD